MDNEAFTNLADLEELDFETPEYKKRVLIFELAGGLFGFPLGSLITVFSTDQITPIPNAPDFMMGLANFRNETLPVIHIGKKFQLPPPSSYQPHNRLIKVPYQSTTVSVFTERVVDLLQYGFEEIINTTEKNFHGFQNNWILETIRFQEQNVCILDISTILKELSHEAHH